MYRNSHKQKITLATDSCSEGDFDKRGALNIPLSISFLSYYYLPTLSRYSVGVIPTCASVRTFVSISAFESFIYDALVYGVTAI